MHEPINRGGGGHRILENLLPLTEDEVARDDHRAAFIALGHESEEDLDLIGCLLDVSDVIEDQELEDVEPP